MPLGLLKNPALNVLWKGYNVPGEKKDFVHVISCDESLGWREFTGALQSSPATSYL